MLGCLSCPAQQPAPTLLVPPYSITIKPVEGNIFLPAVTLDMVAPWPEDLHAYSAIIDRSNETIITLRQRSQVKTMSLPEAIRNRMISLFSISTTVQGRNPGIIIEPAEGLELILLKTSGFQVTDSASLLVATIASDSTLYKVAKGGYDLNVMHRPTYTLDQQNIWKAIYDKLVNDPVQLTTLRKNFVEKVLKNAANHPPYYREWLEGNTIYISSGTVPYDIANPGATYHNGNGQHYFMMKDLLESFKQLIACPEPDSIQATLRFNSSSSQLDSMVITGKWRGIVPLRICFTSQQKIQLLGFLEEHQLVLAQKGVYKASLIMAYDHDEPSKACKIKLPSTLYYPGKKEMVVLDACGIFIQANPSELVIEL